MNLHPLRLLTLTAALATVATVRATVLDFEGIAPSFGNSTEVGPRVMGAYVLSQVGNGHGHVLSANGFVPPIYASNGTDYYITHSPDPFEISRVDAAGFTLNSFDATDWAIYDGVQSYTFTANGFFVGGGSISQSFVSDTLEGFQTFTLSSAWTNLQYVQFSDTANGVGAAYDNIVVNASAVPDATATAGLLGLALAGLVALRRRFAA